ncbi:MAG: phosphate ABC transporter permease subunit PstC [Zymomonas mobilis subsp. pomaceae]|uniref:Phosphate transport system permease protein n=1 Tax=Zymomonas mobilis subsp. pomaceae (strain ATCC 29192 / DSM 22645 / JCM 10191 / CCUG 17912 / NBRC 13757 / NCIMB 11200 / NRRL B-4491 / Barker I) TaxID=579138 RepID=F8EU59_ZYMMT|nr:phosphate ABC transporter permease subunit PstC [Zymomonas mobilis]AEI37139.1 phosphate ABC transporter, inner membrane subunit PstC [Zymomonas mobilis subsp. pomaceae ATCC 29192]MDX5948510.1 phosphate ABC transporter permease subunit PstC [Zymomonas mobilis subsp. pomaceae]GEB89425.1 phosphate transport system permease protein [Zymomonas mobilis subsp. pomaceae]
MNSHPSPPTSSSDRVFKSDSLGEMIFRSLCFSAATLTLVAMAGIIVTLAIGGWPAFKTFGFSFFTSSEWNPVSEIYGAAGPIVGTLITAFLALLLALPLAVGISVFLVEFCPRLLARPIAIAVELLAGIPSIVYGMWGLFVLAPWFANYIQFPLIMHVQPDSWLGKLVAGVPNGANILTASLILAIMILPYMASVFRELFLTVPSQVREAAYGLGATPFEVTHSVTIPYVKRGMIGVIMLGLGRALGETMAVTFIIGNTHGFPHSLFDSGSTIASTIANEFTEATSEMHSAALTALGLVLFLITFLVLILARLLIGKRT